MTGVLLDGKALARALEEPVAARVRRLLQRGGGPPALAILLAGAGAASVRYARMKADACRRVGIAPRDISLPATVTTAELLAVIDRLNRDPQMHGIFLQYPLPGQVDERRCFDQIAVDKDVGGDSTASLGRLLVGERAFVSATPAGIMRLLSGYGIPLAGKAAVVVGQGPMLGKPLAILLLAADATVTLCHSRTPHLPAVVGSADLVVGAAGRPGVVDGSWIRDGAVVIDAGYHPGGVGDVNR